MCITELIGALQVIKAQYGDIEVIVQNQQSFQIQPKVIDWTRRLCNPLAKLSS